MKITELYLKNFGKFSEQHFYFHGGVQTVSGENEFGKSTLHAFIRAMLFGMERGRGKAAAKDDFTRYEPWDDPSVYAGVMRFTCGGRSFRLERSFSRYAKYVSLICEDDGEELSVEQGDLAMLLGGLTAEEFDSTVSVGQMKTVPGQALADSLKNYAANFYETGGGDIDLNGTLQTLRDRKREVDRQIRIEEEKQDRQRNRISQEIRYLERDMERLSQELDQINKTEEWPSEEREEESGGKAPSEEQVLGAGKFLSAGAGGIAAGLAGFAWSRLLGGQSWFAGTGFVTLIAGLILAAGALLLILGIRARLKSGRKSTILETEKEERKRVQIRWMRERIRSDWKEKQTRCENLREQAEEESESESYRELLLRRQALELAQERMKEAAAGLGRNMSDLLNERASRIFAAITEGRYLSMNVDERMEISVWDGVRRTPADRLSCGTLEQIYFALRMAASETLQEEPLPILLDETFAFYDGKRLKSALKWLSGQERQVIIFTCHEREEEILRKF